MGESEAQEVAWNISFCGSGRVTMAGFGDDVSMSDFAPNSGGEVQETQTGVGHTSDNSVLNVQIPTIPPRSGPAAMGAGGTEGFGAGAVSSNSSKVTAFVSV